MVIYTMGRVSTVDADMSHPIDGSADSLDRPRQPDGISVPTRLQASCLSRETVRATSPADDGRSSMVWASVLRLQARHRARCGCLWALPAVAGSLTRGACRRMRPGTSEAREALPSSRATREEGLRGREWPA
jgi:hypothetical protein